MFLRVHHSLTNHFSEHLGKRHEYRAVAEVVVPDNLAQKEAFDYAFRDTNHIDYVWWDNDSVTKLIPGSLRSTSVGDLMENVATGEFWMCMNAGWTQVLLDSEQS